MIRESEFTAKELVQMMDAMKVVASFISEDSRCKVVYNDDGRACADIEKRVIYIPRMGKLSEEDTMLMRTFIYHEGGHIIETELTAKNSPQNKVIFKIFNALEDVRMERLMSKKHLGCEKVFQWSGEYFNKKNGAMFSSGKCDSPLFEALSAMMFVNASHTPSWTLSKKAQEYFDLAYPIFNKVREAECAKDCVDLAEKIYKLLKEEIEKKSSSEEQSEENKESNDGSSSHGKESGENSENGSKDSSEKKFSDSQPKRNQDKKEDGKDSKQKKNVKEDNSQAESKSEESEKKSEDGKSKDAESILEDDIKDYVDNIEKVREEIQKLAKESVRGEYTADTSRDVFEVPSGGLHLRPEYEKLKSNVNTAILGMSRTLEQALRTFARVRKNPHLEHGRIDMRQLVKIGKSLSTKVFYDRKKGQALDTAVTIIVDESGSMYHIMEKIKLLTISLCETLNSIGVPFEVYGSSTPPTESVDLGSRFTRSIPILFNIYKTFGENWESVRERILNLHARSQNIDGEFVQFAIKRVQTRREKRKVVFSLTDGCPSCGYKDELLCNHLEEVCKSARQQNVEVYGFGLGTNLPKRFYGADRFIYLESIREMNEKFFHTFAEIITQGKFKG